MWQRPAGENNQKVTMEETCLERSFLPSEHDLKSKLREVHWRLPLSMRFRTKPALNRVSHCAGEKAQRASKSAFFGYTALHSLDTPLCSMRHSEAMPVMSCFGKIRASANDSNIHQWLLRSASLACSSLTIDTVGAAHASGI